MVTVSAADCRVDNPELWHKLWATVVEVAQSYDPKKHAEVGREHWQQRGNLQKMALNQMTIYQLIDKLKVLKAYTNATWPIPEVPGKGIDEVRAFAKDRLV